MFCRPHVKFVLARALWETDRDRPRALKLVAEAQEAFAGRDDDFAVQQRQEIKAPPKGARGWGRRTLK